MTSIYKILTTCSILYFCLELNGITIVTNYIWRPDVENTINTFCEDSQKLNDEIKRMEEYRDGNDPEHFWDDLYKSNFLTFLYIKSGKIDCATKQIEDTLKRDEHNVNALLNRVALNEYLLCKNESSQQNEENIKIEINFTRELDEQKRNVEMWEWAVQDVVAKAEVAFILNQLHVKLSHRAVILYEEVIADAQALLAHTFFTKIINKKRLEKARNLLKVDHWKCRATHCYMKIINRHNLDSFFPEIRPQEMVILRRTYCLLKELISSKEAKYAARALAHKADLFQNYVHRKNVTLPFTFSEDIIKQCCEQAILTYKEDSYVQEKCGRVTRKLAANCTELRESIELLSEAVRLDPKRDLAYHQLGLAYRVLWLYERSHGDERQFQGNRHQTSETLKQRWFRHLHTKEDNPLANPNHDRGFNYLKQANENFRKACETRKSDSCLYWIDLARTYASLGRVDEACSSIERAVIVPDDNKNESDKKYYNNQFQKIFSMKLPFEFHLIGILSSFTVCIK